MKPVYQDKFLAVAGVPDAGNCFQACVASIFELGLGDVPNFAAAGEREWWDELVLWTEAKGFGPVWIEAPLSAAWKSWPGYVVACGNTARGNKHCVVLRAGELAHDPYLRNGVHGSGLTSIDGLIVFVVLDPSRRAT